MKKQDITLIGRSLVAVALLAITTGATQAQIVGTVDETYPSSAPTLNVVSSFTGTSIGAVGPYFFDDDPLNQRDISSSFVTPGSSDFSISSITMQIGSAATTDFSGGAAAYTIEVYSLTAPGAGPTSPGSVLVGTYTGSMQPTAGQTEVNDYFTFTLSTPFLAEADESYSFVQTFEDAAAGHILRFSVGASAPDGSRALQNTNGGGWISPGQTYINYVQGVAVPEPGIMGFLGLAATGALLLRKRTR